MAKHTGLIIGGIIITIIAIPIILFVTVQKGFMDAISDVFKDPFGDFENPLGDVGKDLNDAVDQAKTDIGAGIEGAKQSATSLADDFGKAANQLQKDTNKKMEEADDYVKKGLEDAGKLFGF